MNAKLTIRSPREPSVTAFQQSHNPGNATHGPQRPAPPNSSRQVNNCLRAADCLPADGDQFHLVGRFGQRGETESASSEPAFAASRPDRAELAFGIVENDSAVFISYFCNYRIHRSKK